jgi:circadian clock protein KaiB
MTDLGLERDAVAQFAELLRHPEKGTYVLRLYVTGNTPASARAIQNIKRLCETYLKDRYELTVIDLYERPEEAATEQVIVAPTLVKQLPLPIRRLLGDLSDTGRVLLALDLPSDDGGQ